MFSIGFRGKSLCPARKTAVDFQTVQFAHIVSDIVLIAQVQIPKGVLRILKSDSLMFKKYILGFWLKSPDSVTIGYWYLN